MDNKIAEEVKRLRLSNKSRKEIREILGLSDTTLSKYSRYAQEQLMTPEEREYIKKLDTARHYEAATNRQPGIEGDNNSYSYLRRRNHELNNELRELRGQYQRVSDNPVVDMQPWEAGQLCEIYALYRLRRAGIQAFRPEMTSKALDIIVDNNSTFKRCEVKGTTKGYTVAVSRTGFSHGEREFKTTRYTAEDKIDFVICVLLEFEQIFIIPFNETLEHGRNFTFSPQGEFFKYLNRFDLL